MSFTDWDTALCHYGVSKANGAPGVGTGNWRRGGSTISDNERRRLVGYLKNRDDRSLYSDKNFKKGYIRLQKQRVARNRVTAEYEKAAAPLYKDRKLFDEYTRKMVKKDEPDYELSDFDLDYFWNHPIKIGQTELYVQDKNLALYQKYKDSYNQYKAKAMGVAKDILSKYGDEPMPWPNKSTVSSKLATELMVYKPKREKQHQ